MTSTQDDTTMDAPMPPMVAERWLLASDDPQRLFALPAALAQAAAQQPLLAWRLRHGLVQRLPLKDLPAALAQALASRASGVNVWADTGIDALDALVWQRVPTAQQAQVAWQAWPAGVDAPLLQALARPDAWAETAWRLDGCGQPPRVLPAGPAGAEADAQAADHAAAFAAWAAQQWPGLDDKERAEAMGRDSVRGPDPEQLVDQPSAGWPMAAWLTLTEPAALVPVAAPRRTPGLMRASAAPAGTAGPWTQLHSWQAGTPRRGSGSGAAAPVSYRVDLEGNSAAGEPPTRLRLRVLLQPTVWEGRQSLQLWCVPDDDLPLQVVLSPAMPENGWLVSTTSLSSTGRSAPALAEWLRVCQLSLSAEVAPA